MQWNFVCNYYRRRCRWRSWTFMQFRQSFAFQQIIIILLKTQIVILFVFIPSLCSCHNHPSCFMHGAHVLGDSPSACIYRAINDKMHVSEVMRFRARLRRQEIKIFITLSGPGRLDACNLQNVIRFDSEFKTVRSPCLGSHSIKTVALLASIAVRFARHRKKYPKSSWKIMLHTIGMSITCQKQIPAAEESQAQ